MENFQLQILFILKKSDKLKFRGDGADSPAASAPLFTAAAAFST